MKYLLVLLFFISTSAWAACTGCGEGGHGACEEGANHSHETVHVLSYLNGGTYKMPPLFHKLFNPLSRLSGVPGPICLLNDSP